MKWLGLDIGGANLKAANAGGWAQSVPFALWRDPTGLPNALGSLIHGAPACDALAVTMTGELCDCYRTKAEGVRHILAAVVGIADGREVLIYLTDGRFVSISEAVGLPLLAAASNWRALADFACRYVSRSSALLVDVGSTTTDIIPIVAGRVAARGRTDTERLAQRELLYSGVGRTPVCAVTQMLPWRGQLCPVAAELFATTADAYVLLNAVDEDASASWTADGRPLTKEFSRHRLARMVCDDADGLPKANFGEVAGYIRDRQLAELVSSIEATTARVPQPEEILVSGSGEFLARWGAERAYPDCPVVRFSDRLGAAASQCAPAYSLAVLAGERCESGEQGRKSAKK